MTNFDHHIDEGLEDLLRKGKHYSHHDAWNFNAIIWWDGKRFVSEVWQYKSFVGLLRARNLRNLMRKANNKYGWG